MLAISLWQPWASLYVKPGSPKEYETRSWPLGRRGWLVIHAARHAARPNLDVSPGLERIAQEELGRAGVSWRKVVPLGALVGAVYVDDCITTDEALHEIARRLRADVVACGNFTPGRSAWHRAESVVFEEAIPFVGRQRLFTVPDSALPASLVARAREVAR